MNKNELVEAIAEKMGTTKKEAEAAVSAFTETVKEALVDGKKVNIKETKEVIHELYNSLMDRPQKPIGLLDITDVLLQVYKKLDTVRYPEYFLNSSPSLPIKRIFWSNPTEYI